MRGSPRVVAQSCVGPSTGCHTSPDAGWRSKPGAKHPTGSRHAPRRPSTNTHVNHYATRTERQQTRVHVRVRDEDVAMPSRSAVVDAAVFSPTAATDFLLLRGGAGGARTHDLTDYERTLRRRNTPLPVTTVAVPAPLGAPDITGSRDFAPRTAPRRSGLAGTVTMGQPVLRCWRTCGLQMPFLVEARPSTAAEDMFRPRGERRERDRVVGDVAAAAVRPVLSGPVGRAPATGNAEKVQVVGHPGRVSTRTDHHAIADGARPRPRTRATSRTGHDRSHTELFQFHQPARMRV